MTTLAQARTIISNRLKAGTDSTLLAAIDEAINDAIAYHAREQMWFSVGLSSLALASGDYILTPDTPVSGEVALPSDFLVQVEDAPFVILENSTNKYPLTHVSWSDYQRMDVDNTGRPRYWTTLGDKFYLYFKADQSYTLELKYLKSYATLSADSDTNDWLNNGLGVIVNKALSELALDERHSTGDGLYERWNQKWMEELNNLRRLNNSRLGSGLMYFNNIGG
jgi:hypothetical protein